MIFGKKKQDFDDYDEEEEIELILFQGAANGNPVDLKSNARLAEVGLIRAKEFVTDGLLRRAEQLRLEIRGERAGFQYTVDGENYPGGRMSRAEATAITQMLKLLAGLNIKERSVAQSGGIKSEFEGKKYLVKVMTTPGQVGEKLIVRIRDLAVKLDKPDDIGFTQEQKDKVRELTQERGGILLAAGPPFSGTTTTAIGLLRSIDAYMYSIVSIGDTDGRELLNITDFELLPEDDLKKSIYRVIRTEADVLFVKPIKDAEAAKTLVEMQEDITLVSELEAKDAINGIERFVKYVGDPKAVAESLKAVFSQKLIRKLCASCKEAFRPHPKLIVRAGLPESTRVLYRPPQVDEEEEIEPCEVCGGLGYVGRTAIIEYVEITEGMKEVIASGGGAAEIKAQIRKEKMPTFRTQAMQKVAEGVTSLEEIQRLVKGG